MLTRLDFQKMKENKDKITMVTAYDYPSAKTVEAAAVDMILVGDSLGMVMLGYSSTIQVTVQDMIHHAKAVRRGAPDTFTVVDMPFMSYHISLEDSITNAREIFQQSDAQAIKVEGATDEVLLLTKRLTEAGIPVVAHIGLTPQTVNVIGGYKVQGRDEDASRQMIEDAKKLADHGAIAIVLECIPTDLGKAITKEIDIPTIGIGAGIDCDGQVLVYHDMLQYGMEKFPKFVKPYADFNQIGQAAIANYVSDVKNALFPLEEHSYK